MGASTSQATNQESNSLLVDFSKCCTCAADDIPNKKLLRSRTSDFVADPRGNDSSSSSIFTEFVTNFNQRHQTQQLECANEAFDPVSRQFSENQVNELSHNVTEWTAADKKATELCLWNKPAANIKEALQQTRPRIHGLDDKYLQIRARKDSRWLRFLLSPSALITCGILRTQPQYG